MEALDDLTVNRGTGSAGVAKRPMFYFMEHGRDHDNREQHLGPGRENNIPPDPDEERDVGSETTGPRGGSRPAPTPRATEREAERHRLEREKGRYAAGEGGIERDERDPSVSREDLDEAAREADERK